MFKRIIWLIISLILVFMLIGLLSPSADHQYAGYELHPLVLPMTATSAILILGIPFLRRQTITMNVLLWMSVWVGIRIILPTSPDPGAFSIVLRVAEVFFVVIVVHLTHRLGTLLNHLQGVIEASVLDLAQHKVFNFSREGQVVEEEFNRSRRRDYSISALVFNVEVMKADRLLSAQAQQFIEEIAKSILTSFVFARLIKAIDNEIRYTDMLVRMEADGRLALICPDLKAEHAGAFAARLEAKVYAKLGMHLAFGVATYPQEAPTFRALLNQAKANLDTRGRVELIEKVPDGERVV